MTPDEFAGFDLDDVVRKAEAEKAKAAKAPKPGAEQVVPSEFFIEANPDYFRIGGIRYCDADCVYDLCKTPLESKTQEQHFDHALNAKPDEFRACSAPLVYAICKALYDNKDRQYARTIDSAREALQSLFQNTLYTLSKAVYATDMRDLAVHFYEKSSEFIPSSLVGSDGLITEPKTNAENYVWDLLGAHAPDTTPDTMGKVNAVFKWITNGKDVSMDRLNNTPDVGTERVFLFKYSDDRVILSAYRTSPMKCRAIGVRPVASVSREDKIVLLKEVQEMLEPARRGKV